MLNYFTSAKRSKPSVLIIPVTQKNLPSWLKKQSQSTQHTLSLFDFKADSGQFVLLTNQKGFLEKVIVGLNSEQDSAAFRTLPLRLPEGAYRIAAGFSRAFLMSAMTAWGQGAYQFARYKKAARQPAKIMIPAECDVSELETIVSSMDWVRDMINMPADEMTPKQLAKEAVHLAKECHATVTQIIGDPLLAKNYPAIHAVGRASVHAPRLIDLRWGRSRAPKVTLVGKGVCFDSGGLSLKSADLMEKMKKDMGGAAHVLGLARMIMKAKLPVRLRVLIPAVENVVSGNAYQPGEIIKMRNGKTVEVTNTDAEGRLILADALTEASSENPDWLIDFATLTGAARVALGPDIAAFFCRQDHLAEKLWQASNLEGEAIWRLPLYSPYGDMLKSSMADRVNSPNSRYAGAITAALFLQEFVRPETAWVHFDIMAYNLSSRPGKPEGGETQGLRSMYRWLKEAIHPDCRDRSRPVRSILELV